LTHSLIPMAAKKSYLIDATQFRRLTQQNDQDLPDKMEQVAKQDIPDKQKYFTYSELYNKYINENALKRRPLKIVEYTEPSQNRVRNTLPASPSSKIKSIPKSYVEKGLMIYEKLKESKDLTWDQNGVYLNKQKLGDIDIADYIRLYVSQRKNIEVEGYNAFKSYADAFLTQSVTDTIKSGDGLAWLRYSFE
jgi:hypothetical protein